MADPPGGALSVAAGSVDISPLHPVPLAGYAHRTGPYSTIRDPLEANAIWLRAGGRQLVVIQLDALSGGGAIRSRILSELEGVVADHELLTVASHTHFAPALDEALPELGARDTAHLMRVTESVADLVHRLSRAEPVAATLAYARGESDCAVNRRGTGWVVRSRPPFLLHGSFPIPNPTGPTDGAVHVLTADAGDGGPLAVLWGVACHPIAQPDRTAVSAEFPGAVRAALRERLGPETAVVFLPGFGGNLRPRLIDHTMPLARRLHSTLTGPWFHTPTGDEYSGWCHEPGRTVASALECRAAVDGPLLASARAELPMRELARDWTDGRALSVHVTRVTADVTLVGLGGEPVVEYGEALRRVLPPGTVIPVGYLDAVVGYLPTPAMLDEGGIEGTSPGYGFGRAVLRHDAMERIAREVAALAARC